MTIQLLAQQSFLNITLKINRELLKNKTNNILIQPKQL